MSFGKKFWDENYVSKLLIGPKQVFSSQLKIITNFHPKIMSQNIILRGHEQVLNQQKILFANHSFTNSNYSSFG
jgi:hypothetical protein